MLHTTYRKNTMRLLFLVLIFNSTTHLFAQAETDFIHIDQFGYRINDEKVAVISNPQVGYNSTDNFSPDNSYQVKSAGGTTVFTGAITAWNNGATDASSGDQCWIFDFSSVTTPGDYYLYDAQNNVKSYTFSINDNVYEDVLKQALRAFYYQRCGTPKSAPFAEADWIDANACHIGLHQDLTCRLVTDPNNSSTEKDLSGGWHDAGDYNKYVNYAFGPVHDLLSAYEENTGLWGDNNNIPESGNGIPDILDELKWELNWLLKMQLSDGSVLMKVSVTDFQEASPPSTDAAAHYYGAAQSSATRSACSMFAHAAIVFNNIGETAYANLLQSKAELAWTWLQNHPGYSNYDNVGFQSSNPEVADYEQDATSFTAAVYLFVLTNQATYKNYVDAHYTEIHAMSWNFWYPFESTFQDALLYYAASANGTASTKVDIINNFKTSVKNNNAELLPAYLAYSSPYRAYLESSNYVWGSSRVKANSALLFYNMISYGIDPALDDTYLKAAENYVHYAHGTNPQNLVYLSNMNAHGATKSCSEIYHAWFGDGTAWDTHPAPGFVPGGPNPGFNPDATYTIAPPENQPAEKAYKDWNTSYPENSWEITEPADGYQAAYIKMLSKFATPSSPLPIDILNPLTARIINNQIVLKWATSSEINNEGFEIQRSSDGQNFEKLDFVPSHQGDLTPKIYQVIDPNPLIINYYRYKQIDKDGFFTYSPIVSVAFNQSAFNIRPSIITNRQLNFDISLSASAKIKIDIFTQAGRLVFTKVLGYFPKGHQQLSLELDLPSGPYMALLKVGHIRVEAQKFILH